MEEIPYKSSVKKVESLSNWGNSLQIISKEKGITELLRKISYKLSVKKVEALMSNLKKFLAGVCGPWWKCGIL